MISVIMPCFLGDYPGAASNREQKLIRAVNSFMDQTFKEKELIIVSDGCPLTTKIIRELNCENIRTIQIEKQPLFSGKVRQAGIDIAKGEIICFLDSDDFMLPHTLVSLNRQIKDEPWVIFNDYVIIAKGNIQPRLLQIQHGLIGTSNIAYKKSLPVSWEGCDGYGHDWKFIQKLLAIHPEPKRIYGLAYVVCHVPNQLDF